MSLDCRLNEVHRDLIMLESSEVAAQRSVLKRYRDCLVDMANGNRALPRLSLFNRVRNWD